MKEKSKRKYTHAPRTYSDIEKEMIQRGIELSGMMRKFSVVKNLLPEGPRESFEKIAHSYADRNDRDRGSVICRGKIDFFDEGIHLGRRNKL